MQTQSLKLYQYASLPLINCAPISVNDIRKKKKKKKDSEFEFLLMKTRSLLKDRYYWWNHVALERNYKEYVWTSILPFPAVH